MMSTQLGHAVPAFDEVVDQGDPDFAASGLRAPSVIRVGRLAVVDDSTLLGAIGEIDALRLDRIKARLRGWLA
jgi:mRNA interferase MazF